MWFSYEKAHKRGNHSRMRDERIDLLHHTLNATARQAWRFSEFIEWYGNDPKAPYVLDISIIGEDRRRVERTIAEGYRKAINAGDYSNLPPFFPGDRTGLTTKRR